MKEQAIWYEPHPISPERKAVLRARGYRVMDAKFMPPGWRQDSKDDDVARVIAERAPEIEANDGHPADEKLRAAIKARTGKAPHWKTKRESLIAQYEALENAADR